MKFHQNRVSIIFSVIFIMLVVFFHTSYAESVDSKKINHGSELRGGKIVVYYFYNTRRCYTCKKIEALTKKAVNANYSEELKKGAISFKAINIDKPENKHYATGYKLYTKSVVLSEISDGKEKRWKNLDQIWQKIHNEDGYVDYIQSETDKYLKGI